MFSMSHTLEHHAKFHPNIQHWGDSGSSGSNGQITLRCFVCGMELVKSPGVFKTIEEQKQEIIAMKKTAK